MAIPDYRIRFPSTLTDFANDVGLSGCNHDNYPPPGGVARYDHMRMVIIGLLSNQASYNQPTEYRDGTIWFDLNDATLKIRFNGEWKNIAEVISLAQNEGISTKSLDEFYSEISSSLSSLSPEIVYSGASSSNGATIIPIPESLRAHVYSDSRAFVYVNGLLIDPRNTQIESGYTPTSINLESISMNVGDTFTVIIRRIPSTTFYTGSVTAS